MKKGWKLLILVSCIVTLFMFFSAISCSVGPIGNSFTIIIDNTGYGSLLYIYFDGSYFDFVNGWGYKTFPGIVSGSVLRITNGTSWLQFPGGSTYFSVFADREFIIQGGSWMTPEKSE